MGIFSEKPVSFKINRKSPLASELKLSISDKLFDFLGNYTDDVLAEYITVLVCNGKHQNQARDDLEAFLGERSGEFISWLWDLLSKYGTQVNPATCLSNPKDVFNEGDTENDMKSNRLKVLLDYNSRNSDRSRRLHSVIQRDVGCTENIQDDLTNGSFGVESSFPIPCRGKKDVQYVDASRKIVNSSCNGVPRHLSSLPRREHISSNLQSVVADGLCTRKTFAADVSTHCPPRTVVAASSLNQKSKGSVWDRLGKPCEEALVAAQIVDLHSDDAVKHDQKVADGQMALHSVLNKHTGNMGKEVMDLDRRCISNNTGEISEKEHGMGTVSKTNAANNIRRKRHFGEISTGLSSSSVGLVGQSNVDPQSKGSPEVINKTAQNTKTTTFASEASKATKPPISQVQNLKERLHQIEAEMSKLRSKQLEMKKGAVKQSEEDIESRTVFVANVHFAATKEALTSFFSKCGMVLNVVILTDKFIAQRKGSAYITFARKDSVDKAIALTGTSFFSRTLKVVRKKDESALTSLPTQSPGDLSQAQFFHTNKKSVFERHCYAGSHLQWQREPAHATSVSSAPLTNDKSGGAAAQ